MTSITFDYITELFIARITFCFRQAIKIKLAIVSQLISYVLKLQMFLELVKEKFSWFLDFAHPFKI